MKTVQSAGRDWIVGLWWQTIPEKGNSATAARKIARQAGGEAVYDCFVLRTRHRPYQAGFGSCGQARKKGKRSVASLAATVAELRGGTWIGRYTLNGGVWVIAVSEGAVLPEGDFFGDEQDAAEVFNTLMGDGEWQEIVDPARAEAAEALAALLRTAPKRASHVWPVRPPSRVVPAIVASVVLGLVGTAWFAWDRIEQQREAEARAAALRAMQERMAAQQTVAPAEIPRPWVKSPEAAAVLRICLGAIGDTPVATVGWKPTKATCTATSVTTVWRIVDGSFVVPPEGARPTKPGVPGETTTRQDVETLASRESPSAVMLTAIEASQRLAQIGRLVNAKVTANWTAPKPVPTRKGKTSGPPPPPPPPWRPVSWTLTSGASLWHAQTLAILLDPLPAVVIDSIEWLPNKWIVKGKVYVARTS